MPTARRQFILACGAALAPAAPLKTKRVNGVEIPLPPAVHPRLYLQARHAAELRARLEHPALAAVVKRMEADAARSPQRKVEWDAIAYLISRDTALGRRTVEDGLRLVRASELPDRNDACRVTGRMMVTGALVYDWLYALLSAAEKEAFVAELIRLAKTQECGYPPTRGGAVTGHNSEAMLMRDILSAGIAIYDEYPEMYELAAARICAEHIPARNWFYPGHAYHQGDSYGPYRYSADLYPLFIFDRMGAGNVFNPEQRWVPYHFVYSTRPDGQRLRAGDTFSDSATRGQPWAEGLGTILTASYYGDGTLLSQYLRQGSSAGENAIFEFLWRDPALKPEPLEELPTSRYFGSPFGWMIARTGWGEDAVVAEMKVNEYNFVNHQHMDAGAFQIYYRGALAVDSGVYEGENGAYGSAHCTNYSWRTVAHNCLLIHDPDETFGAPAWGNDGGQRLPNRRSEARNIEVLRAEQNGYRTGEVLARGFGPDARLPEYTLLQGDLTRAYSQKVKLVRRSSVFLNFRSPHVPAALVVFDRVVSADPSFQKYWLLHTIAEPKLDGNTAIAGRLFLDVLLPRAGGANLTKVGGPGKEHWVFGTNYLNAPRPERLARGSHELAAWRIELSPVRPAAEDLFLTVMQTAHAWPATLVEAEDCAGCMIDGEEACWTVLFRKDATRSDRPVTFRVAPGRPCRFLIADLAPGRWRASREGSPDTLPLDVPADSGAAWFTGPGGNWTLVRSGPVA